MKEIIKKIIIAVVVVIAIGVAVFSLTGDEPTVDPDTSGSSVSTTAPGESTTVPSTDSNIVPGTTLSPSGNQTTDSGANVQQPSDNSTDVQNPQATQSTAPSQSTPDQPTSQDSNTPVFHPTQGQPDSGNVQQSTNAPTVPQQPQQVNKIDKYQSIFKSGNFLMKINDPDLGPVTMAMKGNKMLVEASMEGVTLKMLYDGDKPDKDNPQQGTWYIVIDKIKKYSPISSDMVGDMNVEELTKDIAKGDGTTVYTKSSETLNGETFDCESFTDENGNITKYYFRGDVLVRSHSISPSGEVSVTEFQEITANIDDSLFAIPDGYAKWDISWLMNMVA